MSSVEASAWAWWWKKEEQLDKIDKMKQTKIQKSEMEEQLNEIDKIIFTQILLNEYISQEVDELKKQSVKQIENVKLLAK